MDPNNLIAMANRIGEFFETQPDRGEALEGLATHLQKFWDPRMRRAFLALTESARQSEISPVVLEAVRLHRALLEPRPVPAG